MQHSIKSGGNFQQCPTFYHPLMDKRTRPHLYQNFDPSKPMGFNVPNPEFTPAASQSCSPLTIKHSSHNWPHPSGAPSTTFVQQSPRFFHTHPHRHLQILPSISPSSHGFDLPRTQDHTLRFSNRMNYVSYQTATVVYNDNQSKNHPLNAPPERMVFRDRPKMSEPINGTSSLKRTPPPPPPRSGSWLHRQIPRANGDHFSSPIVQPKHWDPNDGTSTNNHQKPNSSPLPVHKTDAAKGMVKQSTLPPETPIITSADRPLNPTCNTLNSITNGSSVPLHASSVLGQPAHLPVRAEVTDTLLQLLVCHYANSPPLPTFDDPPRLSGADANSNDPAISHHLIKAVCGRHHVSAPCYIDLSVASLARRVMPHLVRIIHTELLNETGDQELLAAVSKDHQTDGVYDNPASMLLTVNPVCSVMTMSGESHQSSADDDNVDEDLCDEVDPNLQQTDVDEKETVVLDVLVDDKTADCVGEGTDPLPPGTSIAELKNAAIEAIHRLVPLCQPDATICERDLGIVRLLASIHVYTTALQNRLHQLHTSSSSALIHSTSVPPCPITEVASLVRLSFYPEHRTAICDLGGVHTLIALLRFEHAAWLELRTFSAQMKPTAFVGSTLHPWEMSIAVRRYICMALTNLTFGVAANKALLCRRLVYLEAILAQLDAANDELKQASASVLRNLCWRTDRRSKLALRRLDAPRRLAHAATTAQRDSALRTTLSALWNISAHCSHNKKAVCSVDGILPFLLGTMRSMDISNRLVIVENGGGIFRNLSSVIACRLDYRATVHQHNCFPILVDLLRCSPSLTIVVNVCGTLWNLTTSPHCPTSDLVHLCHLGVLELLGQLASSSHDLIRTSSTAVLRNLLHPPPHAPPTILVPNQIESQVNATSMRRDSNSARSIDLNLEGPDVDEEDDVSSMQPNPVNRRRLNTRAHLRFGLLSVVLEADDADEEAAEASGDESDVTEMDDSDSHCDANAHLHQEALIAVDSSDLGTQDLDAADSMERSIINCCSWNGLADVDHEHTRVYAEEGTPYHPDSATASCLELHRVSPIPEHPTYDSTSRVIASYNSREALPQVYALEGTPQLNSRGSPVESSEVNHIQLPDDEVAQLPSPPPDFSSVTSPFRALRLDTESECDGNRDFCLPPPPVVPIEENDSRLSVNSSDLQTPLMHSRGSSSYLSSVGTGHSPIGFQSSPPSECVEERDDQLLNDCDLLGVITEGKMMVDDKYNAEHYLPVVFKKMDAENSEDLRLPFAEEGTPTDSSSSCDQSCIINSNSYTFSDQPTWSNLVNVDGNQTRPEVDDDDEDDDEPDQSRILQQCIASAMPTHPKFSSGIPTFPSCTNPTSNIYLTQGAAADTVQSFAVEGTPFASSTKTNSLNDLFSLDSRVLSSSMVPDQTNTDLSDHRSSTSSSHSSSVNGDRSSYLLSEVIQSAMPKSIQTELSEEAVNGDCLQLFAVEGTPGEDDMSVSSSVQNISTSGLNSPRTDILPNSATVPQPPERKNSTLSSLQDPFARNESSAICRPQATVAPMPQVIPSSLLANDTPGGSDPEYEPQKPDCHSTADRDDASSFSSSLLSIESVGLEHSLLQECISSAMPRPKTGTFSIRKQLYSNHNTSLLSGVDPCGTVIEAPSELDEACSIGDGDTVLDESPVVAKVHSSSTRQGQSTCKQIPQPSGFGLSNRHTPLITSNPHMPPSQSPTSVNSIKPPTNSACRNRPSTNVLNRQLSGIRPPTLKHNRKYSPDSAHLSNPQAQLLSEGAQVVLDALQNTGSIMTSPTALSSRSSTSRSQTDRSPNYSSPYTSTTSSSKSKLVPPSIKATSKIPPTNAALSSKKLLSPTSANSRFGMNIPSTTTQGTTLKQPRSYYYRSSLTCPPSAVHNSPSSSRPTSASGSQTNLHTHKITHRLSAQSICDALNKHERDQSNAVPRYGLNSSRAIRPPKSLTSGQSSQHRLSEGQGASVDGNQPKSIRGGRKSLTGFNRSTQSTNQLIKKPVIRPSSQGRVESIHVRPIYNHHTKLLQPRTIPHVPNTPTRSKSVCRTSSSPVKSVGDTTQNDCPGMWIVRGELACSNV